MFERQLEKLAQHFVGRNWRLVTAESCTGGLLAASVTSLARSSEWFEGAFVTYRLTAKERLLGVQLETLQHHGAVSEPVAREMAMGALARSDADVCVAVTGLAGPSGGEPLQPVGTVWFAWCDADGLIQSEAHVFKGTRQQIREAAVAAALDGLLRLFDE
ncbi:MAG: CinA family protein [Pseudomonadales bacterium]|jgi:nicotinamide-nucleotide amidase|nr:CinA family protein [Pseudomonadales bacterium]